MAQSVQRDSHPTWIMVSTEKYDLGKDTDKKILTFSSNPSAFELTAESKMRTWGCGSVGRVMPSMFEALGSSAAHKNQAQSHRPVTPALQRRNQGQIFKVIFR